MRVTSSSSFVSLNEAWRETCTVKGGEIGALGGHQSAAVGIHAA